MTYQPPLLCPSRSISTTSTTKHNNTQLSASSIEVRNNKIRPLTPNDDNTSTALHGQLARDSPGGGGGGGGGGAAGGTAKAVDDNKIHPLTPNNNNLLRHTARRR